MKIKLSPIILLSFIVYFNAAAQQFIWPTNASQYLTSSFAEYRPGHFHAGFDIKTWGKEGYKVFAVRDGYIWRVSVSPFGYGKVLYQKLDTGELAIYAHLQKFNKKIEQIVKREQKKKGEYRINKYFSPEAIPVNQGDVIAFTGSSGVGRPHLHFEMRDQNNRPMNPFLLGFKITDTIPPVIHAISITPLNANSRVNSDVKPAIIKPKEVRKGEYEIDEAIFLYGKIGFAIDCYDRANGVNNVFAVYRFNFYVDGELQFSAVYNKFSYKVSRLVDLDRDYRLNKRGLGLFQKLYKEKGNTLPFYKPIKENIGIIYCSLSEKEISDVGTIHQRGPHNFRIEIYDFNGNLAAVQGNFLIGQKKQIFSTIVSDEDGNFYLTDIFNEHGNFINNPRIFFSDNQGYSWKRYLLNFENQLLDSINYGYPLNIANSTQILKIIADDENGDATFPHFTVLTRDIQTPQTPIDFSIEKDFYDDYVRIELSVKGLLKNTPQLFVQQIGSRPIEVKLIQQDFNRYFGVYQLIPEKDGPVDIEAHAHDLSGKELIFWGQFDIETVTPAKGGKSISRDGKCRVQFSTHSVYRNLFLRVNKGSISDETKYDFVGSTYNIEPQDVPLKTSATIYLKYPPADPLPEKLGIYTKSKKNKWSFNGNRLNRNDLTISTKLFSLNEVTLIRDIDPPEIYIYYPHDHAYYKQKYPSIKAFVKDRLSGIADERSIVVKLDGQKVIAEYDPERKTVKYRVEQPLSVGKHTVSVWAVDNCGNENFLKHSFTIVKNRK